MIKTWVLAIFSLMAIFASISAGARENAENDAGVHIIYLSRSVHHGIQ